MKIFAKSIQLDLNKKEWLISGEASAPIQKVMISYNEIREYKHPAKTIQLSYTQEKKMFTFTVPFEQITSQSIASGTTNWQFFVFINDLKIPVQTDGPIRYEKLPDQHSLFTHLFDFPEGILTFILKPNPLTAELKQLQIEEKQLHGKIEIPALQSLTELNFSFLLKRRPRSDLYLFHDAEYSIPVQVSEAGQLAFTIQTEKLPNSFLVDQLNVLDAQIEIKDHHLSQTLFIDVESDLKNEVTRQVQMGSPYYTVLDSYVTGSNRLSFNFKTNYNQFVHLKKVEESGQDIRFSLKFIEKLTQPVLVIKRRDPKGKSFEYQTEKVFPIQKGLTTYTAIINLQQFTASSGYPQVERWDYFVRSTNKPDFPLYVLNAEIIQKSRKMSVLNNRYTADLVRNGQGNLTAKLNPTAIVQPDKAKKIAVMGTCFSRNAFNSSHYFNPDYKSFFEVSFTQFHTSIISAMTEKPDIEIDFTKYTDMTENERSFVVEDFQKDFFEKLSKSQSDYFLIDLYPDVIRPVIWLNERSAVTLSYVIEGSELLNDLPYTRISDHIRNDLFFDEWKGYADAFIQKLTTIIPEERIILNRGGFTTSYYDKNGKVVEYKNKMAIQKANLFWDQINNYFLKKAPNARVIDFSNKQYIGDFYYPFGHSFSHFESDYYKDFLKELIYIDQTTI
ncbi:DUF6270 domain-containing protein [Listeria ilorinensis]|uniref:DUF6270 domain-containing protein n=1 Tax=Listeria ilorinensis TaxID=2867439 RepID=UPI001EF58214|nr:DUF6270 domain-containing protein [Listeria ilorinensis]